MEENKKLHTTIIYHADADGRMGAAIAKKYYLENAYKENELEFIETNHGKPFPFKDKYERIVIIDFSFKKDKMEHLKRITTELIWIDHHITAKNENFDLWQVLPGERSIENSGCRLAWKYFFQESLTPYSVILAEDYDLWKFEQGNETRHFAEINNVWGMDDFYLMLKKPDYVKDCIERGKILYTRKAYNIENRIKPKNNNIKTILFEGHKTALINNTQTQDGSLLGNEICKNDYEIALKYTIKKDKMIFGLNSIGDINVGNMAKQYGGGGHKNASGFTMNLEEGFKLLMEFYGVEVK